MSVKLVAGFLHRIPCVGFLVQAWITSKVLRKRPRRPIVSIVCLAGLDDVFVVFQGKFTSEHVTCCVM